MKNTRIFSIFKTRTAKAFSLVEVTISLGIMAFVLTGITGLLSGSCSINRDAANDSAFAQITRNVVESLRGQSMDDLLTWASSGESERTFYFSDDGSPLYASGSTAPTGALYRCIVTAVADEDTQSASTSGSSGAVNMVKMGLTIEWPISAANPSNKKFYVQLARY